MSDAEDSPQFESIDWERVERSRQFVSAERVSFLTGLVAIAAVYLYDKYVVHVYLVFDWTVDTLDWVFLVSLLVVFSYVLIPLLRRPDSVWETLWSLRSSPLVLLAVSYLGIVFMLGIFGPLFNPDSLARVYTFNPPVGFTSGEHLQCSGQVSGELFDQRCHGSWQFPLGTNRRGERVEYLLVAGTRPTLYVVLIGGLLVVPIATAVGVVAGLRGGFVDKLLMSYVDLQLSLPALLIYLVAYIYRGPSLLLLLFAFGLLSWGGLARLVRSGVIQLRGHGHVTVARSLGASEFYLARRHILPNITNTLIPAIFHLLALLVLYEAGVSFLGFHEASLRSWGAIISQSTNAAVPSPHQPRADVAAYKIWWVSTFPAVALTLTMLSLKLVGDWLRDELDPRGEQ